MCGILERVVAGELADRWPGFNRLRGLGDRLRPRVAAVFRSRPRGYFRAPADSDWGGPPPPPFPGCACKSHAGWLLNGDGAPRAVGHRAPVPPARDRRGLVWITTAKTIQVLKPRRPQLPGRLRNGVMRNGISFARPMYRPYKIWLDALATGIARYRKGQ